MVPSGPPTPVGGAQSVPPSLMPTNSELLGAQGGSIASQSTFPSIVSPHGQYGNMMGNMSNISSFLSQSFGNGGSNNGLSGNLQRSSIEMGAESHILSGIGNNMGFSPSSVSFASSNTTNPSSGQDQFPSTSGNQIVQDQRQPQQMDASSFQHGQQSMQQFSIPQNQQQQQFHSIRGAFGGMGPMKLEPQIPTDQNGPQSIQSLRNLGPVKLEQQQMQSLRNMTPVKIEPQHSDQTLFVPQQFLMSRQSPQVAAAAAQMSLLQQQRLLQLQQHQQQQLLKSLPQARPPLQQQFQPNLPVRSTVKSTYEPGMCARRLTQYMCHQQQRPPDNNIEFWRKFVAEYFAPNAKKRWCVSLYGSGRQTTGVFPQEVWHCEICNRKPGRGFVATVEVLPRLCKIKYDSGTLEELLYVDIPREYQNASGQIVLDYEKAIQHSVFEQLRVVRHGQLRIVFSTDLKICSWEFCAMRHEELIPRRAIIPQVSHLGAVAQKHQTASQNASSGLSAQELQANCNLFVQSARQLAKALEVPLVNDLGYTKRYVRCLQISEVVNSMKDLIDFSKKTGAGPIECLINFPRRSVTTSSIHLGQGQQPEEQSAVQNSNIDQNSVQASAMQLATIGNAATSVNTSLNTSNSAPSSTIVGLMHQNSINSRQENQLTNVNSSYGANTVQIPSSGSSSSIPQSQANPLFTSQTPSTSSNLPQAPPNVNTACSQVTQSSEPNSNDAHNSVQQMIQEMIMSSQVNGSGGMMNAGSLGTSDMKNLNRMAQTVGLGNGINGVTGISGIGFGGVGSGPTNGGIRAGMSLNGRIPSISQDPSMNIRQQELSNRMMSGIGTADNFNNLQFEWKSPP